MRSRSGFRAWHRLGRGQKLAVLAWVAVLVVALPLARHQTSRLTAGGFTDPGAPSGMVSRAIQADRFGGVRDAQLAVVVAPRAGASVGEVSSAVGSIADRARVRGVTVSSEARAASLAAARSAPGRPVVVRLDYRGSEQDAIDVAKRLQTRLGISSDSPGRFAGGRVEAYLVGQPALWAAYQPVASHEASQAEGRGFPVIAIVLLVVFGSLAAAALPLMLGVVGVTVTAAVIYLLSLSLQMSVFVTSIASMIGIGVAVDYSLFILVRYREEIAAGRSQRQALARAMETSGRAVVLSGITVMISIAALFLIDSTGIRSMAAGAIITVAIAVLAASTLLPALITLLGRHAYQPGRVGRWLARRRRRPAPAPDQGFWSRWTGIVMARPVLCLLLAGTIVLGLALPALTIDVRNSAINQLPASNPVRHGTQLAASTLGAGATGPLQILVRAPDGSLASPSGAAQLRRAQTTIAIDPAVQSVQSPRLSSDQHSALLIATLKVDPESPAARRAVDRLRQALPRATGLPVAVGGTTAVLLDFDRLVTRSLWQLIAFVLAFSMIALLISLRSILLPIKAVLMNVLTVAAAYGVVVAIFQDGWLAPLGIDKAPSVYPITLPLVLVIAIGLSMDYHIFLLTRIRERYIATGNNKQAVAEGLASSATPITSAALIMIAVFLAFVTAGVPSVKQIGVACAAAIAIDATLIRLIIVPAAMQLLGDLNWWFPGTHTKPHPAPDHTPNPITHDQPLTPTAG
jgi:uncharacterized membrane protein YdfJ with MMPL/SSD domain